MCKKKYGPLSEEEARLFLRTPGGEQAKLIDMAQVFAPAPASKGKIVSSGPTTEWALDTIDLRGRTKDSDKYRRILIAQNTYTGYIFALPLASTSPSHPEGTAETFKKLLAQANRTDPKQGPPQAVTTDSYVPGKGGNPEWQNEFEDTLEKANIAHRMKQMEDRNAMGKLDATIRHFRALLFQGVAEDAQRNWLQRLPEVVETYNKNLGHEGSYGSTPDDVLKNPALDFQVRQKMARGLKHNKEMYQKNLTRAVNEEYFRHVLKRDKWANENRARWSEEVHKLEGKAGPYLTDDNGDRFNPKLIKPVPAGSTNVQVPRVVAESNRGRTNQKREAIYDWAKKIHKWILKQPDQKVHTSLNQFAKTFKDDDAFFEAMKKAQLVTARNTQRYTPTTVVNLFIPTYFRKANSVITAVGTMPAKFDAAALEEDPVIDTEEQNEAPIKEVKRPKSELIKERLGKYVAEIRTYLQERGGTEDLEKLQRHLTRNTDFMEDKGDLSKYNLVKDLLKQYPIFSIIQQNGKDAVKMPKPPKPSRRLRTKTQAASAAAT